jgi:hypothetical protein
MMNEYGIVGGMILARKTKIFRETCPCDVGVTDSKGKVGPALN